MVGEEAAQPGDRVGVQVVGRLVEQQDAAAVLTGVAEQDPGQFDAPALAAGEGADGLGQGAVGQAEVGADPGRLGLGRVPAEGGELVLQRAVAADQAFVVGALGQLGLQLLHLRHQHVQAAGGEHPVPAGHVKITGTRVLRKVADGAAPVELPGVRLPLAGEDLQGGGLAGAVAADEADPVTRLHPQRGVGQQDPGTGAQLQAGGSDHVGVLALGSGRADSGHAKAPAGHHFPSARGRSAFAAQHGSKCSGQPLPCFPDYRARSSGIGTAIRTRSGTAPTRHGQIGDRGQDGAERERADRHQPGG